MRDQKDIQKDVEQIPCQTREASIERERIEELKRKIDEKLQSEMTLEGAKKLTSDHIAALDKYNTCKEHTQKIIKTIASIEEKTLNEVYNQFGISSSD